MVDSVCGAGTAVNFCHGYSNCRVLRNRNLDQNAIQTAEAELRCDIEIKQCWLPKLECLGLS